MKWSVVLALSFLIHLWQKSWLSYNTEAGAETGERLRVQGGISTPRPWRVSLGSTNKRICHDHGTSVTTGGRLGCGEVWETASDVSKFFRNVSALVKDKQLWFFFCSTRASAEAESRFPEETTEKPGKVFLLAVKKCPSHTAPAARSPTLFTLVQIPRAQRHRQYMKAGRRESSRVTGP